MAESSRNNCGTKRKTFLSNTEDTKGSGDVENGIGDVSVIHGNGMVLV